MNTKRKFQRIIREEVKKYLSEQYNRKLMQFDEFFQKINKEFPSNALREAADHMNVNMRDDVYVESVGLNVVREILNKNLKSWKGRKDEWFLILHSDIAAVAVGHRYGDPFFLLYSPEISK